MSHSAPFLLRKNLHFLADILNHSFVGRRIWGYLVFLLTVSIGLTFWLTADQVEAHTLFQSPQSSPVAQPSAEQSAPAAEPPAEQSAPAAEPPAEQSAPAAEQAAPATQPSAEQPASTTQSPVSQPATVAQPAEVQPTSNQNASPAEQTTSSEVIRPGRERDTAASDTGSDSKGSSNFILDQAELIDTVVVSGAYIWLCCGVSLFLLVPLGLLFVYIRGRSKLLKEERY